MPENMRADAAARYAAGIERVEAIADDLGVTSATVYRAAREAGVPIKRGRMVVKNLREHVGGMKPLEAVDMLLDLCEKLMTTTVDTADFRGFRDLGFSPAASRILVELNASRGEVVPLARLQGVSNPNRHWEVNADGVLRTHISVARKLLRKLGLPVEFVSHHGDGYSLKVDLSFRWSWETEQ